jgi:hypothetical protein
LSVKTPPKKHKNINITDQQILSKQLLALWRRDPEFEGNKELNLTQNSGEKERNNI